MIHWSELIVDAIVEYRGSREPSALHCNLVVMESMRISANTKDYGLAQLVKAKLLDAGAVFTAITRQV
jgi:hypothetical protein